MRPIIIFAGTIEGRTLSEYLSGRQIPVVACVATEYGGTLLEKNGWLKVHEGRMDQEQMEAFLQEEDPLFVVDATHPYAAEVSKNIRAACASSDVEYIRLIRESVQESLSGVISVNSVEEAVAYLRGTTGNILATTGSKELVKYTALPDYEKRVFARVLSTADVAASCERMGFAGRHLICMQGPFSEEMNTAMLRQFDCRYLVTKETGKAGGFEEKIRAAGKAGAQVVLVGRPPEQEGYSYEEVLCMLRKRLDLEEEMPVVESVPEDRVQGSRCQVTLVGIGMGTPEGMTLQAEAVIRDAEVLIGAKRMLEAAGNTGKPVFVAYDAKVIADYIREHPEYRSAAVLLSGDIGFYSGAKRLYEELEAAGCEVHAVNGISSVVYFCGKLRMPWEDVCLMSTHGRRANLVGAVRTHRKTFTLLSAGNSVQELCRELRAYGLDKVTVHIGERLGYEDEKIRSGIPEELEEGSYDGLCVALIENPESFAAVRSCIDDEEFLRGKAPMTKSEIRSLSVAKLQLPKDAVVYDVGAGTGSVTVEMALQAVNGMVYAVERNEEACGLIEENKRKFGTPNIEVIHGLAPEALEGLPAPTHAFIGGSAGNLKEIMECLLRKNPAVRMVINTVTLETIGEVTECLRTLPVVEEETISVSVARSKLLGKYHLMMGQNPIYIITCRGGSEHEDA